MPDAAHSQAGVSSVSVGSAITVRGVMRESLTGRLTRVFSSVIPATAVNAPAESVVGIAMWAGGRADDEQARLAITLWTAALAVSIGLPPPKLMTASASCSWSSAATLATLHEGTCCRDS